MRSEVYLTRDIQCSASASVFGQSGYIYPHKLKKNKFRLNFVPKMNNRMPYVQIMCLILKLSGNIGPKWAVRVGGEGD